MSAQTVTATTFTVTGPGGAQVAGTVKNVGRTGIFTPEGSLAPNTIYTARISTGAEDMAGNAMTGDYAWTFITGATP